MGVKQIDKQIGGDHYKSMEIQPIVFCQANELNACESNIVKYACRHKQKGHREDLLKVIHYAQLLIELEYEGVSNSKSMVGVRDPVPLNHQDEQIEMDLSGPLPPPSYQPIELHEVLPKPWYQMLEDLPPAPWYEDQSGQWKKL